MTGRGWVAALRVAAIAAVGVAGVAARSTQAQEVDGREVVRLAYSSAPGCPSRESFEARVRARTARAAFVDSGGAARIFEVQVADGPVARGRFSVWRGGAVEGTRQVDASSCDEVADALALAVALAIDPSAAMPGPTAGAAATSPAPSASSVSSLPPSPPPPAAPSPARPSVSVPVKRAPGAYDADVPAPLRWPETLSFSAEAALATGVVPEALVGFAPRVAWQGHGSSLLEPALALSFVRAASATFSIASGDAAFLWTVGRADGCVLAWPALARVRLRACARAEAGQLLAEGSRIAGARTQGAPWLALGPLARLEWSPLPPLFLSVEVAGMVHVTDDRFYFVPDTTIHVVPLLGTEASVGVGVRFL